MIDVRELKHLPNILTLSRILVLPRIVMLLLILASVECIRMCLIYGKFDPDFRYITGLRDRRNNG